MPTLAPELWRLIFTDLRQDSKDYVKSKQALRNCTAVNHFLRDLALPHAWRDVTCLPETVYRLATVSQWRRHNKFFHKHPKVAEHVRELHIEGTHWKDMYEEIKYMPKSISTVCAIDSLVAAFPNLSTLTICDVEMCECNHRNHKPHLQPGLPLPQFSKLALYSVILPVKEELPSSQCFLQVPSITTMVFRDTTWLSKYSKYYGPDYDIKVPSPPQSLQHFASSPTPQPHAEYLAQGPGLSVLRLFGCFHESSVELMRGIAKANKGSVKSFLLQTGDADFKRNSKLTMILRPSSNH